MAKYTYEERKKAAEMAGDIGIPATMRECGYPKSWASLRDWCSEFGVEIVLDELKSKAAQYNSFYEETELRIVQQEIIARSRELMESPTLTPAEMDKLSAAIKKATDSIQMLRGKATSRTAVEDTTDADALRLFDQYRADADGTR